MNYHVNHVTTYAYSEPVAVCHNQVILSPRAHSRVNCKSHRLSIRPEPTTSASRTDYFGNHVSAFSVEQSHRQLTIAAHSHVTVRESPPIESLVDTAWEEVAASVKNQTADDWLDAWLFGCDSPRIHRDSQFEDYAASFFTGGRGLIESLMELTASIFSEFTYDPKATDVQTSTLEAFQLKSGVCQDFAHVQIACLRSLGIPARYVSGYLRTEPAPGTRRLVGADESHAWLAVYAGSAGWVEVDPTNNAYVSCDHIPIAYGRDYSDVAPIRGAFLGGGVHQLKVSVDVRSD